MQKKFNTNEIKELILFSAIEILKSEKILPKNKKKIILTGRNTDFDSVSLIKLISLLEDKIQKKFKINLIIADNEMLNNMKIIQDTDTLFKHVYLKLNAKI
jgi:acyl carrier protein|tara:strand:+ start:249 stop:551 length:303 start_codon:yes stop_codon:yes gene_type:complete